METDVQEQGARSHRDTDRTPPSVSVVIPVYNGEKFIRKTIESAAAQTYPHLKIIAVDDGSTDGSREILADLKRSIPNLEVLTSRNQGVARARNRGIEASDCDYVAFLDHDDLWHATKIDKQMMALLEHAGDPSWAGCYTANRIIDEQDRLLRIGIGYPARGFFFGSHLVINHIGNGSNFLVRRSAALEIGGFDPSYRDRGNGGLEDWDFQLRFLQHYKAEYVPECLVGYRVHGGTMSSEHDGLARCVIAVIEKFSGDRRVPPTLRRVAMSAAHRYAAPRFFLAGKYGHALRHFFSQLYLDPLFGPRLALSKLWYRSRDWLRYRQPHGAGRADTAGGAPGFYSLDPTELLAERNGRRFKSLEKWLAEIDRQMEDSTRNALNHPTQDIAGKKASVAR